MAKPQYFVSYSREDKDFVVRLVNSLRNAQVNIWLDKSDIPIGQAWDTEVQAALDKCDGVIVVLSPSSVKSKNVLDEIAFALKASKALIPIVYRNCIVPLPLVRSNYIDLTGGEAEGLEELAKHLRTGKNIAELARGGPYTPTVSLSVEDVLAILSMAPRKLVRQFVVATFSGNWSDRYAVFVSLKGLHPAWLWSASIVMISLGIRAIVFWELLDVIGCLFGLLYVTFIFCFSRYVKRRSAQAMGLALAPFLPHRPPSASDSQRRNAMWSQLEPVLWEIAALPADKWADYLETIHADEDAHQQLRILLSIFTTSVLSAQELRQARTLAS